MDFWQAYQGMKRGEWHQAKGSTRPYCLQGDTWVTVDTRAYGQGVWDAELQSDVYEFKPFIVPADEDWEYSSFQFMMDELDAEWEKVVVDVDSIGVKVPSPEKLAHDRESEAKLAEMLERNPPIPVTWESISFDRMAALQDAAYEAGRRISGSLEDKVTEAIKGGA